MVLLCLVLLLSASHPLTYADETSTQNLKTFGTMGKAVRPLAEGKEAELLSHTGRGCLTHMWFGGNFNNYGLTRIRVYVDGEEAASIDMEMMMGHGIGFQDTAAPWGIARIGKTGQPSGIYNTYRIPFGKSIRVTAQLAKGEKVFHNPQDTTYTTYVWVYEWKQQTPTSPSRGAITGVNQ